MTSADGQNPDHVEAAPVSEPKVPSRLRRASLFVDVFGFGGAAMLLPVLAEQLNFLPLPTSVFWILLCTGTVWVVSATAMGSVVDDAFARFERSPKKGS